MTTLTIQGPRRLPAFPTHRLPPIDIEPLKARIGRALGMPAILPGRWYL